MVILISGHPKLLGRFLKAIVPWRKTQYKLAGSLQQ